MQEVHIINKFSDDFYGEELRAVAIEYIRPELNFKSLGNGRNLEFFLFSLNLFVCRGSDWGYQRRHSILWEAIERRQRFGGLSRASIVYKWRIWFETLAPFADVDHFDRYQRSQCKRRKIERMQRPNGGCREERIKKNLHVWPTCPLLLALFRFIHFMWYFKRFFPFDFVRCTLKLTLSTMRCLILLFSLSTCVAVQQVGWWKDHDAMKP